jgi:hypothetical protein
MPFRMGKTRKKKYDGKSGKTRQKYLLENFTKR